MTAKLSTVERLKAAQNLLREFKCQIVPTSRQEVLNQVQIFLQGMDTILNDEDWTGEKEVYGG